MSTYPVQPIDQDLIDVAFAEMQPSKRRLEKDRLEQVLRQALPRIRAARAQDSTWATIVAGLAKLGIKTSVKRVKEFYEAEEEIVRKGGVKPPSPKLDRKDATPEASANGEETDEQRREERPGTSLDAREAASHVAGSAS